MYATSRAKDLTMIRHYRPLNRMLIHTIDMIATIDNVRYKPLFKTGIGFFNNVNIDHQDGKVFVI